VKNKKKNGGWSRPRMCVYRFLDGLNTNFVWFVMVELSLWNLLEVSVLLQCFVLKVKIEHERFDALSDRWIRATGNGLFRCCDVD
jgi:hypothetical protein